MAKQRLALLQQMPIFGGLRSDALTLILELAREIQVPAGSDFFSEGDDGKTAYVLERGRVQILKSWEGTQFELRELGVGDCFGEMALIDFGPRSASVHAIEDASGIELSGACLLEVAKQDMEQYAMIQMNMARELSRRLRLADERLFRARMLEEILDEESTFSPI